MSANGLGFQDTELAHWIEAGCYTENVKEVAAWFNTLWDDKQTREISDSDLEAAAKLWKQRRSFRPTLPFSEFDARAVDVPLISWYGNESFQINPKYSNEVTNDAADRDWPDDFYPIEGVIDETLLAPGTWLLFWKMNANGRPSQRPKCYWFRAGAVCRDFVKVGDDEKWNDAILDQSKGIPPPFDCSESLFNKVFREVVMLPKFKNLRDFAYNGSFLNGRVKKMREMWPVLQEAYWEKKL